jgi:carbonic anhydrase-like protein
MTLSSSDSLLRLEAGPIELGAHLPMVAYHAIERWHPERIGALALYCSDGRWGEAFDEFCHRHLLIPRYDRWAVPGGPAWLAAQPGDGALLEAAQTQLDFLVRVHDLERFVLITHYGCAWYGDRLGRPAEDCLSAQIADLRAAAAVLRGWYPALQVEGYLAMREHEWLSFRQLDVNDRA